MIQKMTKDDGFKKDCFESDLNAGLRNNPTKANEKERAKLLRWIVFEGSASLRYFDRLKVILT